MFKQLMFVAAVAVATGGSVSAIFMRPDLEKVPVTRLVDNLEKAIKEEPKNAGLMLNLARTHAMAYSQKTEEVQINKKTPNAPWLGFSPKNVPFSDVKKTDDKDAVKKASEHLAEAVKWYEATLKADAKNKAAILGHAWIIDQSGKKDVAIKMYRNIVTDAWDGGEKDLRALGLTGETMTTEAGGYLVALLDAEKDKDEIADLKAKIAKLKKLPRPVTPIAIPLQDGLDVSEIEDRDASVKFDADGTGEKTAWSWIRPNAAWLVYDPQGKGDVNSALQFFGNVTFRLFWSNGYVALASLDDNRDGELRGSELKGLALWHDVNGNGVADPGEVKTLAGHGIVALSCRWETKKDHADKIAFSVKGVTFRDGKTRPTYDVILKTK